MIEPLIRLRAVTDSSAPGVVLDTPTPDPVLNSSFPILITFTKGPIVGTPISAHFDIIENCTIDTFTNLYGAVWQAIIHPTIDGQLRLRYASGKVTWNSISNSTSNILVRTYDSGASYDLQNGTYSLSKHSRLHEFSITRSDDVSTLTNFEGGELISAAANMRATIQSNSTSVLQQSMYLTKGLDFGFYMQAPGTGKFFTDLDPLITTTRNGNHSTVGGYQSGVDSYKDQIIDDVICMRNNKQEVGSGVANPNASLPIGYPPTASEMNSLGICFREEYYSKTTAGNYANGQFAAGMAKLAVIFNGGTINGVSTSGVIPTLGLFTNFSHWAWWVANYEEAFLAQLNTLISGHDVFRGSYNDIMDYSLASAAVDSISATGNTITVNHTKKSVVSPYSKIGVPVFIRADLSATVFAGHDIALSNGLKPRSMGSNVYGIPIMLDFTGNSTTVNIGIATSGPNYLNLNQPNLQRSGNTITSDIACNMVLFRIQKPTAIGTSVTSITIPSADNVSIDITMVESGLSFSVDQELRIYKDASNYFFAMVVAYNSGTKVLTVSTNPLPVGSGTYSSWTVQQYYHRRTASRIEVQNNMTTSQVFSTTFDFVNYKYAVKGATNESIQSVIEFES